MQDEVVEHNWAAVKEQSLSTIEISLLGVPQVLCRGGALDFPRRKAVALLAYLAVHHQRHSRDLLATLLWPDNDEGRARAALRRVLATLNETPLSGWLDADRETIMLRRDADLSLDVAAFTALTAEPRRPEALAQAVALYRGDFLTGFSLRDSAAFDAWQTTQTQHFQQQLIAALDTLSQYYVDTQQYQSAVDTLRRWLTVDSIHEAANTRLMQVYQQTGQRNAALAHYESYAALLDAELGVEPDADARHLYEQFKAQATAALQHTPRSPGTLPALPQLVLGREATLADLKRRVIRPDSTERAQAILQGWPGIGKTTLTAVLAHDVALHAAFPDGILWASLGQEPNLLAILLGWARSLGIYELDAIQGLNEASARLTAVIKDRRIMVIVDDAWNVEHARPLLIGGQQSGLLVTTRLNDVAYGLAAQPDAVLKVPILSEADSVQLLRALAPAAVAQHPHDMAALAHDLEGLPLALQVAGRLLHAEMALGWGVLDLLAELRDGARLLAAQAPADRAELVTETTPSVAALLQRSVAVLPSHLQEQFGLLGVFAPKPATFTLDAIAAVWDDAQARDSVRVLVDRGLLESLGEGRFQMHALLVMLARSLFAEDA